MVCSPQSGVAVTELPKSSPIIVKRYARSRLYDTTAGRYLTIADLRKWAERAISFVVLDAETGEHVTRELLA
jgi:polyhydroxyalkanoate synthesis regulator protein